MKNSVLAGSTSDARRRASVLTLAALGGITVLAAGLRWYAIDAQSLWLDEAASVSFSVRDPLAIVDLTFSLEPNPPLYYLLLHIWIQAWGMSEAALRSLSALAGTLTVPLVYVLGRRLFDVRAGLLAALVIAGNPMHVWLSQEARAFALLCLAGVLTTAVLLAALRTNRAVWWLLFCASATATLYLHLYGLLFFVALLPIAFVLRRPKRAWVLRFGLAAGAALLAYVPWLLSLANHIGQPQWRARAGLVEMLVQTAQALAVGEEAKQRVSGDWWPLWAAFGLLALLQVRRGRQARAGVAVLALWFFGPLLLSYLLSLYTPIFVPRYLLVIAPAYYLAVGASLSHLSAKFWPGMVVALGLFVWGSQPVLNAMYTLPWKEDYRTVSAYLKEQTEAHDSVVLIAGYTRYAFAYYGLDAEVSVDTINSDAQAAEILSPLGTKKARVWLAQSHYHFADPHERARRWLGENCNLEGEVAFTGVLVSEYLCQPRVEAVPGRALAVGTAFGDRLRLEAMRLPDGSRVRPGETVRVALYWRALAVLPQDYQSFLHLVGGSLAPVAQHDRPPGGPRLPTTAWRAGDLVLAEHRLNIPADLPPGEYRLLVGVYSPAEAMARLAVAGERSIGGSALEVASIAVVAR